MKREVIRFAIAGAIGFLIDAGVLYGALSLGAGYFLGRIASFMAAVWVTWQINRRFTFSRDAQRSAWAEWWTYLTAMAAGGIINYAAYSLCILTLPRSPLLPLSAVAVGSIAGMTVNFLCAKFWVFRRPTR